MLALPSAPSGLALTSSLIRWTAGSFRRLMIGVPGLWRMP